MATPLAPDRGPVRQEPIAIIGMACIFPQAPDLKAYWRNILASVDAVGDPQPEWEAPRYLDSGRITTARGGYLRDLYRFDPRRFGIMPNSLDGGEPDQFLALRVAHDALVDGGYGDRDHDHTDTGIVLGHSTYLHRGQGNLIQHQVVLDQTIELLRSILPEVDGEKLGRVRAHLEERLPQFNADVAPGLVPNVMTGRIANRLDLKGPNYLIDAACSSSLLAVGAAMDELRCGRSRMMLAGGVNGSLPAEVAVIFTQLGALSRRGKVRPFEAGSDGTLLGEGLGVVLLKTLSDAQADGDRIYAVVHGVGQASDGRGLGLLAPSMIGESLAIRRAYDATGIDPKSIELVEAHGTGIALGDRTEIAALKSVLGERVGAQGSVAIGSVKSMISHCIPAAGIAGLIKTALALHHRILPPTLCEEVNPELGLGETPLYVNVEPRPWIRHPGRPRRAGINSFGFGGINTHAILEEAPAAALAPARLSAWPHELCVFSASSDAELRERVARIATFVEHRKDLAFSDLAATLAHVDRKETHRLAFVARDAQDLLAKIRQASKRLEQHGGSRWATRNGLCYAREPLAGKVAFMFPGEGSQYIGMFRDLALHFPAIRRWLETWRGLYDDPPGDTRIDILFPPASELTEQRQQELAERIHDMDVGSEAAFVGALAMNALLHDLGVRPDVMVGHSTGESCALAAAGAMPGHDLERMADWMRSMNRAYRALLEEGRIPTGALMTVGALPLATIKEHIGRLDGGVLIAMDNCPNEQVLFGDEQSIATLHAELGAAGGICNRLPFDRGYHTPHFLAVQEAFFARYGEIDLRAPRIPVYSCSTTGLFPSDDEGTKCLATGQWTTTVRFRETVERMHNEGVRIFIEVGPSGSLSAFANDILAGREFLSLATDKRQKGGAEQLLSVLANLYVNAKQFDPVRLFEGRSWSAIDLDGGRSAAPQGVHLDNTMPIVHIGPLDTSTLKDLLNLSATAPRSSPAPEPAPAAEESDPVQAPAADLHEQVKSRLDRGQAALAGWESTLPASPAPAAWDDELAPLLCAVIELDERHVVAECQLLLDEDRFLRDHVLSGRVSDADPELLGLSCVPLTVSLEIMAEACALLAGSAAVRTIENVKAFDWIALDDGEASLQVRAELVDAGRQAYAARIHDGAALVMEAEFTFRSAWRAPAAVPLAERRPYTWASHELYTRGMFHGPIFQSVAQIDGWSDEGIDGRLSDVRLDGFLEEGSEPRLVLNPVLLDALTQLSAYWIGEQVGPAFNSFPSTIERIELYRDCPQGPGMTARCRQRGMDPNDASRHDARVWQFEVVDGAGTPIVRVTNLVNVYFPVPEAYYRVRHDPLHGELGRPYEGLNGGSVLLWELTHLPEDFCLRSSGIFLRILAHAVLSEEERAEWRALDGSARQRRQWLLSRVCLKEAVRRWLFRQTGQAIYPADIVVSHDELGAPRVDGWWADSLTAPPAVSLSHNRRVTVAAVTWPNQAIGVDVEVLGDVRHTDLVEGALATAEREALHLFPENEWPERAVRLWCAKESAAKAYGTGLLGRPDQFHVSFGHEDWRNALVRFGGLEVEVCVARDRDMVVALAAGSPVKEAT